MICLMNPPFNHSLHLQILEKSLQYTDNTICLSPSAWLDKISIIRPRLIKFREALNNKLSYIKIYKHKDTKKLFNIGNAVYDLAIVSTIGNTPINTLKINFDNDIEYNLYRKLSIFNTQGSDKITSLNIIVHKYLRDKTSSFENKAKVPIYTWHSSKTASESLLRHSNKEGTFLYFDTEEEVDNFRKSLDTKFMNWWNDNIFLKMDGKIVNMCPILTSYKEPVDDEYFYKVFDLNDDEIKIIEEA